MGCMIYIGGEIKFNKAPKKKQREALSNVQDAWGSPAFGVDETGAHILPESIEACDPFEDGVEKPLKEFIELLEKFKIKANGTFFISSDWSDYDNIAIIVEDNKVSYGNTEIVSATDEELIVELLKRGYKVSKKKKN